MADTNMRIYTVIENREDCPESVCIEFESEDLIRVGSYVCIDFFGKRIFKVIKAEGNTSTICAKAVEIGLKNKLLVRKKDINIFKMAGLKVETPSDDLITQAEKNSCLI